MAAVEPKACVAEHKLTIVELVDWLLADKLVDAATFAQRALGVLARPFTVEGRTLSVTASIGISVYPNDGRDFGELLKNADAAANHAKETGRNSFHFFSPELNARAVARLGIENDLRQALVASNVPGRAIELEVTERVLMSRLDENVATLRRLGEMGVRVAIDDFGTGYSSLDYLRQLPIDKLKIDRSFLRELEAHPNDATIVQTIAAMARALGLRVAAEGVEGETQLARLAALGCDEWQGHHYSASLEAADFERLFRTKIALAG
jgi:predicted signal transduction protein with EAL and GGDEF domain